jgi:hypothetical protein
MKLGYEVLELKIKHATVEGQAFSCKLILNTVQGLGSILYLTRFSG